MGRFVLDLHDEFTRCFKEKTNEDRDKHQFHYTLDDLKPCIKVQTYSVRVPYSGKELNDWANILHNCMGSYFNFIKHRETIIYGFFKENILAFSVEVKNKAVLQASSKYNTSLTVDEQDILDIWFNNTFL